MILTRATCAFFICCCRLMSDGVFGMPLCGDAAPHAWTHYGDTPCTVEPTGLIDQSQNH